VNEGPPRLLIAGCGFLGNALAHRALDAGWIVEGWTHSPESAQALRDAPFRVHPCDLAEPDAVLAAASAFAPDVIVHCASSGRGDAEAYRKVYVAGMKHLAAAAHGARLLFTGSTSVYAQADDSVVTEESPAEPGRETGRALLDAERVALAAGGIVARLAGLYGPGRSVLVRKFLEGTAVLEAGGGRWINQIHRDDAAAALLHLADQRHAAGIYNVCDNTPLTQRDVYAFLSEHFGRPLPPEGPADLNRKRGWTSKRISNAKLRATGWEPRYPSFRDAVRTGAIW